MRKISKKKNINWGKSKCCKAEVDYSGGGYDGEDIVPIVMYCKKCGKVIQSVIQKVGRPSKTTL
jgi:hypothetical protein